MTAWVAVLTDESHFPHVLAGLTVALWALVLGARLWAGARTPVLALPAVAIAAVPYAGAGPGMAVLSLALLLAAGTLERVSLAVTGQSSPGGGSRAGTSSAAAVSCAVLSGGLLVLGGVGLMVLTPGGPAAWSWWIGIGTAAYGACAACLRGLAVARRVTMR